MLEKFYLLKTRSSEEGFTLVELMVVIIIIGILAAIAIPIFANQQKAAIDAQTKAHIKQVREAIELGRIKTGKTLLQITGATCTSCLFSGTDDPLKVPKTHPGWGTYYNTLDRISTASGMNVRNLLDGYGRPIFIDENEGENNACLEDIIASFKNDFAYRNRENEILLSPYSATCSKN